MNAKYIAIAVTGALAVALAGACAGVGDSQQHLRSAVEAERPTLDDCYGSALQRDDTVAGEMALLVRVDDEEGRVHDVEVQEAGVHDAELEECVTSALVGTTLEETPDVDLEVHYTFQFEPAS